MLLVKSALMQQQSASSQQSLADDEICTSCHAMPYCSCGAKPTCTFLCSLYLHVQADALCYIAGIGRGLLGVVGLPLSGALGLVGAVTNGLASSAGLVPAHALRRPGRTQGVC